MFKTAFLLAVLVLGFLPASAQIPNQAGSAPPVRPIGTAMIRGRVMAAGTGAPLRRAVVRVSSPENREGRVLYTDGEGRYEIRDLPAGRYVVSASMPSYIGLSYGQTRPFDASKPIEIKDRELIERVDLVLPRGGVITGRVIDEFGEPVPEVTVMAERLEFVAGRRRATPVNRGAQTNDIGEFRLFGLQPGQYYVSARFNMIGGAVGLPQDRAMYAPTYYPGTPNDADAQRVPLGPGQEVWNITIPLVVTPLARISGVAIDSDGRPMVGATVRAMQRRGTGVETGGSAPVAMDGTFTISHIRPGEYVVQAGTRSTNRETAEVAAAVVNVNGADISGLRLAGQKPIAMQGTITFESGRPATIRPQDLHVRAYPSTPEVSALLGPSAAVVNDDWSFEIKANPGPLLFRVDGAPLGWQLKTVRIAGQDVTDGGIDLRRDGELRGFDVIMTSRLSQVTGAAVDSRNQPVRDYVVVVFPEDRAQWHFQSRRLAFSRPDRDGRFKATGLPPGEYLAIALDAIEPGEQTDPEFLERVRTRATRFSLADGETKTMVLSMQPPS